MQALFLTNRIIFLLFVNIGHTQNDQNHNHHCLDYSDTDDDSDEDDHDYSYDGDDDDDHLGDPGLRAILAPLGRLG